MNNFDAVILADGDFPANSIPLEVLKNATYLCCCDGAASRLTAHGMTPDAIVGDGDSITPLLKEKYRDILHIVNEQDDNDLTKATRHCMSLGFKRIAYIGASGRREDHTISNIALMERYMNEFGLQPVMFTDYGYFLPASGTSSFRTFPRQQVSIFNFTCSKIKSRGLKWNTYAYKSLWQGTLNEAEGNGITLETDGIYMVFFTYEPKKG